MAPLFVTAPSGERPRIVLNRTIVVGSRCASDATSCSASYFDCSYAFTKPELCSKSSSRIVPVRFPQTYTVLRWQNAFRRGQSAAKRKMFFVPPTFMTRAVDNPDETEVSAAP